jgi:signal transduction histidine kinase
MYLASLFTFASLLPFVSAIFTYVLGFFVWLKNRHSPISILFFSYCFVISIWLFGTFKLFNAQTDALAIFWDRFIYIGVAFIPIILYHFGLLYCSIKSQQSVLWMGYVLALFFLAVSQTDWFVRDLFFYEWGVHTRAQLLHHPFLIYFFGYFVAFFVNLFRYWRHAQGQQKKQALHLLIGFFILDAIGPLAFLPAYGISVYPVIFLSAIPFVLLVAYAMVKYHALNVKLLSVEIFSTLVIVLFLAEAFLSVSIQELLVRLIALGLVVFFVLMLMKSVYAEVRRREEIERLNQEIADASQALQQQNHELVQSQERERIKNQEVIKLKDEFVFIASHELKAPVFAIKGFLELVEGEKGKIPPKTREYLQDIHSASEHLNKLVNDLLQVARGEAGTIAFHSEPVDLLPTIELVVKEQMGVAQKRGIEIHLDVKEHPLVMADASKWTEVITNLVNNAIKYNRDQGRVDITVVTNTSHLLVSVKDTGHGIPKDQQDKIFGKFFRASGKATEGVLGTGLGLFITKNLVEKMGGSIAFTSIEEVGTTFVCTFPLVQESNA